ncbi:mucin-12 [Nilaparvata lugens]|uniref:mucin-12 n=1 Tax=Nilaparvata lugens TaxID=108931 RepID=UPI00193D26CD|nr:mucin-12 [Nilaparvata lugens]
MSRCMRGASQLRLLPLFFLTLLLHLFTISSSATVQARSLDGADQRWRDWLLVEDTAPADVASAPGALVRRITPKSVFVAPNFHPGCKEGQQIDAQGRCVQIVRVDQAAHLDFLLKRFNSMFAPPPPPSKKVEKDSPGPFHVSLPLGGAEKLQETGPETIKTSPESIKPLPETIKTLPETVKPLPETLKPQKPDLQNLKPHSSSTTLQPLATTTPLPQLTTTPPPLTTTHKTETTTLTMPPASTDPTTELLNFSDESTTSRVTHETLKPTTFFTQASPTAFLSSPTTTLGDEVWSSHKVQTMPTTQTETITDHGSQTEMGNHRPHTSFEHHRPSHNGLAAHGHQTLPTIQTDVFGTHRPQGVFGSHRPLEVFGSHRPQTTTDVFEVHGHETLPTTQTDVFESHRPQDVFGSHRPQDVFGSHRPETLPTEVFESHRHQDVFGSPSSQTHTDLFGSHRPQTLPTTQTDGFGSHVPQTTQTDIFESHRTTFNTQNPEFLFQGVHRTRPSSLQTSTATAETGEDSDKTASFPSHTTLFTSPTLQTIQPFEGLHRTRPSSLQTTFPVPSTVKTNEVFTLKGFQQTTPTSSELSYTSTTSATTTYGEATPTEDESDGESLIFSGDSDNKKPFVIIVANNTFKRQEPVDYDSTTESTSGSQESTTVLSRPTSEEFEGLGGDTTTESSSGTRFSYFPTVLTPPPTIDEYSLEEFPAVEEAPTSIGDKETSFGDSLDVAASFQQMNAGESVGNKRTKCDSTYEVSQVRDGRIISQSSVTNCQPEGGKTTTTTTPQPPLRTLAPTNFRFPLEAQTAGRPSFIRFPEVTAGSSYNTKVPAASDNYNTKLWGSENNNYGADSSKQSYYWPQQWNPFPSSVVRGWPVVDRSQVSSNVYRKQYYHHPMPQWMNKNTNQYSWPGRV